METLSPAVTDSTPVIRHVKTLRNIWDGDFETSIVIVDGDDFSRSNESGIFPPSRE